MLRIGRADATAPAARLGLYNADRHRGRGRPGLDPRVQSGPAARLDIDRRVSDASTVKTAHPPRHPPQENAYRIVRSGHTASLRSAGWQLCLKQVATLR